LGPPNMSGVDCHSHQPNKATYSIPCHNTFATHQHIEGSLCSIEHVVAYTTYVLKINYLASKWHIARLPPNSTNDVVGKCEPTWTLWVSKVIIGKHGTHAPTYKGLEMETRSTNNMEYDFYFCHVDIKKLCEW
jgi:hypothetical protein